MKFLLVAVKSSIVTAIVVTALQISSPALAETQLQLSTSSPQFGQKINVSGSGFPPKTSATVSICGNSAQRGSKDCSWSTSNSGIDVNGKLNTDIYVQPPPVDCPCVVSVSVKGIRSSTTIYLPSFSATEVVSSPSKPSVKVTAVKIGNPQNVSSQWGGSASRPVGVTVTNAGDVPIQNVNLRIDGGLPLRGESTGIESFLVEMPPGSSKQILTDIETPIFSAGSLSVRVSVAAEGSESFSEISSSSVFVAPWYLLLAAVIALQLWVLTVVRRNEVMRRNRKKLNKLEEPSCKESSLA